MEFTIKLKQIRPSTSVDFHDADDDLNQLKLEYASAGKLTADAGSNSEDGLTRTWVLVFSDMAWYSQFFHASNNINYNTARKNYNALNNITEEIILEY